MFGFFKKDSPNLTNSQRLDATGFDIEKRKEVYRGIQNAHQTSIALVHVPYPIPAFAHSAFTPAEIIFLWYMNGKPTTRPNIGIYWDLEYNLVDYQPLIEKFFAARFLEVSTPAQSLSYLTAAQMKDILDDYALSSTGSKVALAQRIVENIPDNTLNSLYKDHETFTLTESGRDFVKRYEILIYWHKHRNYLETLISLQDASRLAQVHSGEPPEQVIIDYLSSIHQATLAMYKALKIPRPKKS